MRTTQEYFNMSKEELQEIRNEYGYTREECKLLDEGLEVHFCSDEQSSVEDANWLRRQGYTIERVLKMIDGRVAVIAI